MGKRSALALLAAGALLSSTLISGPLSGQIGGTTNLAVQVLSAQGQPVAGASVCAGTAQNRAATAWAQTNATGFAMLALPQPAGEDVGTIGTGTVTRPTRSATLVTASAGSLGAEGQATGMATMMLRLPAGTAGGPICPTATASRPATGGGLAINGAQVRADLAAAQAGRAPIGGRGPVLQPPQRWERCFGAIGQGCGDLSPQAVLQGRAKPSTCFNGVCSINAGSWTHDECCFANPDGAICDGKLEEAVTAQNTPITTGQACIAELNLGIARLASPFNWQRQVNFGRINTTGRVERELYCAPTGTFMHRDDGRFCCSGRLDTMTPGETALFLLRPQADRNLMVARICR